MDALMAILRAKQAEEDRLAKLLEIRIVLLQMHAQRQGLVIPAPAAAEGVAPLPLSMPEKEMGFPASHDWTRHHKHHQHGCYSGRRTSDGGETIASSSSSSSSWAAHHDRAAIRHAAESSASPRSLSLASDHVGGPRSVAMSARSLSKASTSTVVRAARRDADEEVDELASDVDYDEDRQRLPSIRDHPSMFPRQASPESFLEQQHHHQSDKNDRSSVKLSPILSSYNNEAGPSKASPKSSTPRKRDAAAGAASAPKRKTTSRDDHENDDDLSTSASKSQNKRSRKAATNAPTMTSVAQSRKDSQDSTISGSSAISATESFASARSSSAYGAAATTNSSSTRRPTGLDMLLNAVSCSERGITSLSS